VLPQHGISQFQAKFGQLGGPKKILGNPSPFSFAESRITHQNRRTSFNLMGQVCSLPDRLSKELKPSPFKVPIEGKGCADA
jgi:hypothetical protein